MIGETTSPPRPPRYLLVADDDEDDRRLIADAIHETHGDVEISFVANGRQLLDYLRRQGEYAEGEVRRPDLVLLDLNMPVMDGREALQAIKKDQALSSLPVMVLSTSTAAEDIRSSYQLGANAYITKPDGFDSLVDAMQRVKQFWLELAKLPYDPE